MPRNMLNALMDEEKRGTLANPGSASPLGPTIPMRIGATLNPMLERVQDIFPKDNPYGSFIERLIVGDSPERTGRMAEGIPHQYTGAGPMDPIIRPQIVDLAGALPIGSAATLAKAAAPLAVPTAMATGAGLLGRALKGADYAPTSTEDIASALLTPALQRQGLLDDAMVGGEAGAAALARIGNTAPQQAMELAEQMESAGRTRDEIWAATADLGYPVFRGKDGQLRFEIDDSAVRFKEPPVGKSRRDLAGDYFESKGVPRTKRATGQYPVLDIEALDWADANRQSNPTVPVYESIIHPEMQQAYPDSGVRIGRIDPSTRDLSGYFDPATKEIRYGGGTILNTNKALARILGTDASTALHELQHATQGAEGFARGGSPGGPYQSGELDQLIQRKYEQIKAAPGNAGETDEALYKHAKKLVNSDEGRRDMYRALAGEAEARQVQARMDMTPAARAVNPFYADYDVPEADQIVRYGDGPSAMVAYQGSPHKFEALDPTKIGTGEGAQAYGHGAYVAESKDVAGVYKSGLSKHYRFSGENALVNGKPFKEFKVDLTPHQADILDSAFNDLAEGFQRGWFDDLEYGDEMLDFIDFKIRNSIVDPDNGLYGVDGQLLKITASDADAILNKIDSAKFTPDPGHLYEIDVPDEDIAKMLDWDKPLSEQPESVRRQLLALEDKMDGTFWDNDLQALESLKGKMSDRTFTGEDLLGDLGEVFGHATGRETSEYLNSIGIPGIKYYDQGSRGAGEGTRNMVLFDDLARRAKVLKRNEETIAQPSVDEFIGKLLED